MRPMFIKTANDWNGKKCIISVVGTRNIKSNNAPIRWSLLNKRNPIPKIKQAIAPIKRTTAKGSGIPLFVIELRTELNLTILGGMAIANVVAKHKRPKKSNDFLVQVDCIDYVYLLPN